MTNSTNNGAGAGNGGRGNTDKAILNNGCKDYAVINQDLKALVKDVETRFHVVSTDEVTLNQVAFDLENRDVMAVLAYLRAAGWRQLSILTCVDWIKEGQFQLVYILMNWDNGVRVQVRTRIDREKPVFQTVTHIYPGAKYYERDVHEFFGVVFEGNDDALKQLFLENWDDMPPLRKDFISRDYSDRKYARRQYKKSYVREDVEVLGDEYAEFAKDAKSTSVANSDAVSHDSTSDNTGKAGE